MSCRRRPRRVQDAKQLLAIPAYSSCSLRRLRDGLRNLQRVEQLLHRIGRLLQRGLLLGGQRDLDDLLDAVLAELHRYADVEIVEAVLAGEIGSAGEDLALVFEDRFD